ncbi:MAG: 30S ribosomal protein S4 [Crocinitomicaceae bacterium]|jgi:small subunit ribosomal protein S4|nr:30S ribosomal protein S4 [Crocinitomicaceae bacterium]MDP4723977.1 30S ribosomal protein S4 [Crocinitomicaceae bacterium]MDP4739342.1 30S ribosomal protein S4 [Crocinitomicaceae bacterium]MDP4798551.1 30S ribosomal protein S4 [Crocinitomicaceae bacterium]MDP4806977.1 30S ribosomal protein S4 [Crocinitomicaceae bacterium]
MARYRGPKSKIARRFRDPIFGPDKSLERRNYGPGQHGPSKRRGGKQSEYAVQLGEKQKAKYTYGILERQFANMFEKASRMKGITGEVLLQLCEARLDNTVYRLGISPTRRGARQLVSHKHITVNGEVVNIPSYTLRIGDVVGVREKSKSLEAITGSLTASNKTYDWLDWDSSSMSGKLLSLPAREMIPENIREQLIVELYSK